MSPQSQKEALMQNNQMANIRNLRRDSGNLANNQGSAQKIEKVSQSMQLAQMKAELNQASAAFRKGNS